MIPLFYQEYDGNENALSRYEIVKRHIFSAREGEPFSEDDLGEAVLLPGGIIYSVEMYDFCDENGDYDDDCDGYCSECERDCIHRQNIPYPVFTSNSDAVKYRKYDGSTAFGVVFQWDDAPPNECYIIPLDSEQIRYHDFKHAHDAHEHIPCVLVERISADDLSDKMRQDYLAYVAFLKENAAWA